MSSYRYPRTGGIIIRKSATTDWATASSSGLVTIVVMILFHVGFMLLAKKTVKNAASDGFGSNFSDAAFCLAQPIGGLLVHGATS